MKVKDEFHLLQTDRRPETDDDRTSNRDRLASRKVPKTLHDLSAAASQFEPEPDLVTAINMAISVGAPLLLTGEPGTGKTQVAWYLAWYFDLPVFDFQVKSTSTAVALKYDFDAVAYLRESRRDQNNGQAIDRSSCLHKKALWEAYEHEGDCVVLIDEIDKAPRDFPNDLLQELDNHEFDHPFEKQDNGQAKKIRPTCGRPPIVIVSSNAERRLPDAFLRRCIVHHIRLTEELIDRVVKNRVGDFPGLDEDTKSAAVEQFWKLRGDDRLRKKPATSELIVWLSLLDAGDVDAGKIQEAEPANIPSIESLIKDHEDQLHLGIVKRHGG